MLARIIGYRGEGGLGVVQIATADQDSLKYSSSAAAIKNQGLEFRELDQAGRVNTIQVLNRTDEFIFLMDGDILVGAKQNRVLNTSVFLAPRSKTQLPVSCVEQGRWSSGPTLNFDRSDFSAPSNLRADKACQVRESLRMSRGHTADQVKIWEQVEKYRSLHGVDSMTGSLTDVYREKEKEFEAFVGGILPNEGANGVALYAGKELVSVDIFNRREIFREYFPKLLRGVVAEHFFAKGTVESLAEAEASYRTLELLDTVAAIESEEYPGVGAGVERRFETRYLTGFELRHENQIVHMTVLTMDSARPRSHRDRP